MVYRETRLPSNNEPSLIEELIGLMDTVNG
ncbi:MAG: hypothetical protein UY74_C0005G0002 [Candidatus Kaiserbacteria bacterium GW2011_GWC2_52_8b]|uniref:Uncharacterized protein n=2 Tax=Candidatus Kaiseribacteriota TaxID=1752734 RepID=A0A0G1XLR3_9BACT|nr:MAG: hypothetical protein UY67_C0014G0002 [Candidatus Kaiserbacteria bacterium GW2011_GWA2_52_12]KKW31836.1 MAG: hypothetical protein UY74_C0005G0002 [Candidatus Kaiserbacteria bacterium GW2011_GWC2_52_8b]